jgi:hypothetical protein
MSIEAQCRTTGYVRYLCPRNGRFSARQALGEGEASEDRDRPLDLHDLAHAVDSAVGCGAVEASSHGSSCGKKFGRRIVGS